MGLTGVDTKDECVCVRRPSPNTTSGTESKFYPFLNHTLSNLTDDAELDVVQGLARLEGRRVSPYPFPVIRGQDLTSLVVTRNPTLRRPGTWIQQRGQDGF